MKKVHAKPIFHLLNECYANLYGFSQLNEKQIEKYTSDYISFADMSLIPLIYNENNELVGCGIMIPSLARTLVRCRGKLFPFGWWQLIKTLYIKNDDTVEFLLIGVRPDYQGKGLNSLLATSIHPILKRKGYVQAETNCNLVTNNKIVNFWSHMPHIVHKKRRAFIKDI